MSTVHTLTKHALWVHGHSGEIEYPDRVDSIVYKGNCLLIQGNPSTTNWLHFAVPTPVIIDDSRMQPVGILFRYRADGGARVDKVDIYDGENIIATDENPRSTELDDGWSWIIVNVDALKILSVMWGIGISIKLRFGREGGQLEFDSAGCDFGFANRVAPQRLQIYTRKAPMEFPYHSNLPIDVSNEAIERILISLHGSGAGADVYLSNGLAAIKAAADTGVDSLALTNTLVIAPQFIGATDYWRTEFPRNLLYWSSGWRASGSESIEQDLDGDGVPDSGTLCSFTAMDVLLERVCRRSLFPNLKIVVIAGHSNGGRFMSCYSTASRFENEVAVPRGIHVRYLVMGSGSYVYMNDRRLTFENHSYPATEEVNEAGETILTLKDNWRDTVVTLYDFGTVCSENPGEFNDWPHGLNMPIRLDGNPVWPYSTRVGAEQIRSQFGARDVHYVIGIGDDLPSFEDCPERVQGQDTLTKTLLYYRHLEQFYGSDDLRHQLHVLPNIGHSGLQEMTSLQGLAAIFGPV
jgi:hypothetical protein